MKETPSYDRFYMLDTAWQAALDLHDDRGNPKEDSSTAVERFLKRKACRPMPESECRTTFAHAVGIVQATQQFRRSQCGTLPPKASRRYELLHTLASQLEESFPDADIFLTTSGCKLIEAHWDT